MASYLVKCSGQINETYIVEADSEDEAMKNWCDGELVNSEAWDVGAESAELDE